MRQKSLSTAYNVGIIKLYWNRHENSIQNLIFILRIAVNTLTLAKPEKGRLIEANLIRMAQTGQLGGKLSEEELIGLLERFSEAGGPGGAAKTKVKFDRRRAALDSDSDWKKNV